MIRGMHTNPSHEQTALDHVAAVKAASQGIRTTHEAAERADTMPDRRRLGELNALLGRSLKLAEVHATLAVAEAIREQTAAISVPLEPLEAEPVTFAQASHCGGCCPACDTCHQRNAACVDGMGPQLTFDDATTADVTP